MCVARVSASLWCLVPQSSNKIQKNEPQAQRAHQRAGMLAARRGPRFADLAATYVRERGGPCDSACHAPMPLRESCGTRGHSCGTTLASKSPSTVVLYE